jgi:hypothetical protein
MTSPELAARFAPPAALRTLRRLAIVLAVAGGALAILVMVATGNRHDFYFAYLTAYVFWIGVSVGCLALVMLQFVTRGAWGVTIRRLLESGANTLPLMAVLFVPIVLGVRELFEWARTDPQTTDAVVRVKLPYLNVWFFVARAAAVFAVWLVMALQLQRWSSAEDRTGDSAFTQRARNLSGAGIVLYGLTVTVAATDWVMSLDPRWTSSIFGILFMGGWGLSGMSFAVLALAWLSLRPPLSEVVTDRHLHDVGNLMFALVLLFAYFNYSQFVIIWSGNLPEEASWYLRRMTGGWESVGLLLVAFHFVVPATILLSRDVKQRARALGIIAAVILLMRFVEAWYLVGPEAAGADGEHAEGVMPDGMALLLYALLAIGVGGLWMATFTGSLMKRPLLPPADPLLPRTLALGHEPH